MKARLSFLLPMLLLLGPAAVAQSTIAPEPKFDTTSFVIQGQGLSLPDYAAPSAGQEPVLSASAMGESSSRKHPYKAGKSSPAASMAQAFTAQDANQAPCEKPAKLFSAREYSGPLNRFGAWFSRKPELTTVPAITKSGKRVCGLDAGQKFVLFLKTTVEPMTFLGAGAKAGFSQANNDDPQWGQGAEGYGKRYGAAFTDRATRNFFSKFFYPTIFQQDPRYFRKGQGSTGGRIGHALAHTFVARSNAGNPVPNFSLWAASISTVSIENLYHPGRDRGFGPAAQRVGAGLGESMAFDLLKEFWPEIVRKFHLPFKERKLVPAATTPEKP
jgi:hypothetical protein